MMMIVLLLFLQKQSLGLLLHVPARPSLPLDYQAFYDRMPTLSTQEKQLHAAMLKSFVTSYASLTRSSSDTALSRRQQSLIARDSTWVQKGHITCGCMQLGMVQGMRQPLMVAHRR